MLWCRFNALQQGYKHIVVYWNKEQYTSLYIGICYKTYKYQLFKQNNLVNLYKSIKRIS